MACRVGLVIALVCVVACGGDPSVHERLRSEIEAAGVLPLEAPTSEPETLVTLGRALFFDPILSGNRNISCATCHHPTAATGDALPLPIGEGGVGLAADREVAVGRIVPRNAPPLFNVGLDGFDRMFWDGRLSRDPRTGELSTPEPGLDGPRPTLPLHAAPLESGLAAQAMFPPTSHVEMRGQPGTNEVADAATNEAVWAALMARLVGEADGTSGGIPEYRRLFRAAFPEMVSYDDLTFGHAARALAAFERESWTLLDSPFDRYLAGDDDALAGPALDGAVLFFGEARCSACHRGRHLTDFEHHALAVPQLGPGKDAVGDDPGRELVTGVEADRYRFRTAPLRGVAATGPWMHDGAYQSLEAVLMHHLDCEAATEAFDAGALPGPFRELVDDDPDRAAARMEAVDPMLATPVVLGPAGQEALVAFLEALTDPRAFEAQPPAPERVPSGLPVDR